MTRSIHFSDVAVPFPSWWESSRAASPKFALLLFLLFSSARHLCAAAGSSSSSRSSGDSSSYVSVRALDEFGDAVQVNHAAEAAHRHGRLVVAAVVQNPNNPSGDMSGDENDETRTVGEAMEGTGALPPSSPSFMVVVSVGNTPVVHSIRLPLATESGVHLPPSMLAMCCTGIKGDATWLVGKVQRHVSEIWEYYGQSSDLSSAAVSHLVARLLGRFSNHQEKNEWQSSLGLPGKNENKEQRQQLSAWARPMGVQTMILSCSSSEARASGTREEQLSPDGLLLIEPSGRILTPIAQSSSGSVSLAAMGKDSDKIQTRLVRLVQGDGQASGSFHSTPLAVSSWSEVPPTLEICRDTLIRIILEEVAQSSTGRGRDTGGELMVEIFSTDRGKILDREVVRYENPNVFFPISRNSYRTTRGRR